MTGYLANIRHRLAIGGIPEGLLAYYPAAFFARMATGGSAVAVILLARQYGIEGTMTGLLAACLTAPHVLGPLYGRWLDHANDARKILSCAAFAFPLSFLLAIWGFTQGMLWLSVLALLVCGACSSFLMGGLSSQLIHLVEKQLPKQRLAQSWDTITYGIGLTLGPMLIALLVNILNVEQAVGLVMTFPFFSGILIFCFPRRSQQGEAGNRVNLGMKAVVQIIVQSRPLKITLAMTSGASFAMSALPVLAVFFSEAWLGESNPGAWLATAYGAGCICGAVFLVIRPLKSDALTLLKNIGASLLVMLLLVIFSQNMFTGIVSYLLCGVVNSIFFAATLAARTEHAPSQGAAQIYLWVAAAKITAASLGAFLAGFFVDIFLLAPLILSVGVLLLMLLVCFLGSNEPDSQDK